MESFLGHLDYLRVIPIYVGRNLGRLIENVMSVVRQMLFIHPHHLEIDH